MSKFKAEESAVETFLDRYPELSHLKVIVRGSLLTIISKDDEGNTYPHVRLRKKSIHKSYLEMPVKNGWEPTFIEGTDSELIALLVEKFPWALAPR